MKSAIGTFGQVLASATLLTLGACAGGGEDGDASASASATQGSDTEASGTDTGASSFGETEMGDDGGEPPPPNADVDELCDAGDEAWVKRAIPMIAGRKPEGIREVRLLVSMIEQIDAAGGDGREEVARGLADGDRYIERWYDFFFEQLRINRIEVKANYGCYGTRTSAAQSGDLAAFIRDNDAAGTSFGASFSLRDVIESSLRLDDITPAYRADLFARMARPLTGANVSQIELEIVRRANYGEIFETAYLGRRIGCLECHNSEDSVTYNPDPALNHHWAIPGSFERAVFGDPKGRPEAELFAAFRWGGFVTDNGPRPWGMSGACGGFINDHSGDLLGDPGYLGGPLPDAPQLFDVDPKYRQGLTSLADQGLVLGPEMAVDPDDALAFLLAANIVNHVWQEAMGYPLTLANSFPRNAKQREILQELTELFIAERYSVRELVVAIATHPYFNQDAPDACGLTSPYHLDPVWEPFASTASDPNARGNSVGDRIQRYSAWVLIDSAAQSMWWARPQRLGEMGAPAAYSFLRDQGIFVKDALPGFNGVDFSSLLSWEERIAAGDDPKLQGACTGPLGGECASFEWIELMLTDGAAQGLTIRDVAVAIKDRLITEPEIYSEAEEEAIEGIIGAKLDLKITAVNAGTLEAGARRFAGLLLNTPQFMLAGVPSRDQDPAADPKIVVAGTDTASLCEALAPALLAGWSWSCDGGGVKVDKK
ncbi:MAG: hypothetical protein H6710_11665 [Myxococcales bacterium]|nr:hypothetical protein [Myxococcales bacterium]